MKPPPFDYVQVKTIDEALSILNDYGDDAQIIAGGQSIVSMLNMRLIIAVRLNQDIFPGATIVAMTGGEGTRDK